MIVRSIHTTTALALVSTLFLACGNSDVKNGTLQCGAEPHPCPTGYVCSPKTHTCWLPNTEPDAGTLADTGAFADAAAFDTRPSDTTSVDLPAAIDATSDLPAAIDARDGAALGLDASSVDLALIPDLGVPDRPASDSASPDAGPDSPAQIDTGATCPAGKTLCDGACVVIPAGGCCLPKDCAGTCMTCGADHLCAAVKNADDPNLRCTGTCDATGVCKKKKGQSCQGLPTDCASGTTCSPDGICCDRACTGSCEACDSAGLEGTCTVLANNAKPRTGHAACTATDATCAGKCDGTSAACSYTTAACGAAAACTGGTFQAQGICGDGACKSQAPQSCANACVLPSGCTGICTPDKVQCSAMGIPQKCTAAGAWQDQLACATGSACTAGACVCAKTTCGTACVDLTTDTNNCGSCGHSCAGGTCLAGKCQPVVMIQTLPAVPAIIGVDAQYVYYQVALTGGGSNSINRIGRTAANGSGTLLYTSGNSLFSSVGLVETNVVANEKYERLMCSITSTTSCASSLASIPDLTSGDRFVNWRSPALQYVVSYITGTVEDGNALRITWRAPGGGLAGNAFDTTTSDPGIYFRSYFATGSLVYWIRQLSGGHSLFSASSSGSVSSELSTGLSSSVEIVDANAQSVLLWDINTSSGIGTLYRLPAQTTGSLQTITTIVSPPSTVLTTEDSAWVYWFDGNGGLNRCTPTSCASSKTTLATGQSPTGALYQDSTALYWVNASPVGIVRIAK